MGEKTGLIEAPKEQTVQIINSGSSDEQIVALTAQNMQLKKEKEEMESRLKKEIEQLKQQVQAPGAYTRENTVQLQSLTIANLQKKESELIQQIKVPPDAQLDNLIEKMQKSHSELLTQQLNEIKKQLSQTQPTAVTAEGGGGDMQVAHTLHMGDSTLSDVGSSSQSLHSNT